MKIFFRRVPLKIFIFLTCTLLLYSTNVFAETLKIGDHKCEVHWKQFKKNIKVWGKVMGGEKCQQLNVSVYLANSKTNGRTSVQSAIKNYRPDLTYNTFKAENNKVYSDSTYKNRWFVKDINLSCLH